MQSVMTSFIRRPDCAPKTFNSVICAAAIALTGTATIASPASAFPGANGALEQQLMQDSPILEIVVRRGAAVRRTTVVGPRGNVASRTVVRRGAVVRPGVVAPGRRWVRPANYYWRPGGAIAAGAAIGFVAAATAAAWAGAPPAPGYCWYYTDPGRTQGFWDTCP
jgi:hypothetical protein